MGRRIALLATLYITQGIAPGFTVTALPVLLRGHGLSLEAIGIVGLITWPWTLKFLWGPLLDRYYFRRFGRRRSWIVPLQLILSASMVAVGFSSLDEPLRLVLVLIGSMNIVASALDVATDGYASELLEKSERGIGNSAQIGGFYIGSIIGGGAFLIFQPRLGWNLAFIALATCIGVGLIAALTIREEASATDLQEGHKASYRNFFQRPQAVGLLLLILLLDFGENFGVSVLGSFFVDAGMEQEAIGWISGTLGLLASLLGAFFAGVLVGRLKRSHALVLFSSLQALAMSGYVILSLSGEVGEFSAGLVLCVQFFLASVFNVALYAWFMDWTSKAQAATDFSIMACAHNATFLLASPLAGWSAANLGYAGHFGLAVGLSVTGILLAWRLLKGLTSPEAEPMMGSA